MRIDVTKMYDRVSTGSVSYHHSTYQAHRLKFSGCPNVEGSLLASDGIRMVLRWVRELLTCNSDQTV